MAPGIRAAPAPVFPGPLPSARGGGVVLPAAFSVVSYAILRVPGAAHGLRRSGVLPHEPALVG